MALQTWGDAILDAWDRVVDRFINYIPNLFGAIIILILGWILAMLLEKLIDEIIRSLGLQKLFEMVRIEAAVKKTGVKKDTTALIAALVRWTVLIVAFLAATDTLQLPEVTNFFSQILGYLPEIASAAAIILIGVIAAHFVGKLVRAFVHGMDLSYAGAASSIARYAIIVFAVIAALIELGIAESLLLTLFTGFIAMLAIAGGLAFGLGGKEVAGELLRKVKDDINSHKRPNE